ncbi:MAG TPA: ABC transporter permease, partial [Firmicutes bacterium]|nr:ABC transporter permease [Bacillota bacterium]
MRQYLHEILKRKDLMGYLVVSGLKAQHRNSYLGYFWWLLDPLLG